MVHAAKKKYTGDFYQDGKLTSEYLLEKFHWNIYEAIKNWKKSLARAIINKK